MDTPGTHLATNANFRIGSTNFTEYFNGTLDEVALFNHALTATEIAGLATATGPLVLTVYSNDDSGPDTLRQAVTDAATYTGPNHIIFSQNAIKLATQIVISDTGGLTIDGSHPTRQVTIDGENITRLFTVNPGANLLLKHLHLTRGNSFANLGGAIFNQGTLTLHACSVSRSSGDYGGGIYNSAGTLILSKCTLTGNSSQRSGGAVFSGTSDVGSPVTSSTTIDHCTFSDNSADTGGAIWNNNGLTSLSHCTITRNSAAAEVGSGVGSWGDPFTATEVEASIVAGNTNGDVHINSATNSFSSQGHNLIGTGNATGNFSATGDVINNLDPVLSPLAFFGGPVMTIHPLAGSPAIDAADASSATTDQRGFPRSVDGDGNASVLPDIGAVESGTLVTVANTTNETALRNAIAAASTTNATVIRFSSTPGAPIPTTDSFPLVNKTIFIDASDLPDASLALDREDGASSVFTIDTDSTLALHNVDLGRGFAIEGGGVRNDGDFPAIDSAILSNTADTGGGLWIGIPGRVVLDGSAVDGNTTGSSGGGGIYNGGGPVVIRNSSISGNISAGLGGGIWDNPYPTRGDSLDIVDSTINDNQASVNGGGIFSDYGTERINGGTISGNQAASGGGVASNDGCFFFTNVTIGGPAPADGNTATGQGGGLSLNGGAFFTSAEFVGGMTSHNNAGTDGGGYANGSRDVSIDGTLISNNTAGEEGGGLWQVSSDTMTITNATISNNTANSGNNSNQDQGGGGIFNQGTLSINASVVQDNTAQLNDGHGGGIYNAFNGDLVVNSSTLSGNKAIYGGGIQNDDAIGTVNDSTISGNESDFGGGIILFSTAGNTATLTLNRSTISGNEASSSGGGVITQSIDANSATLNVNHCTIALNSAANPGGGLLNFLDSGTIALDSSVIANNQSGTSGDDILGNFSSPAGRTSIVEAHLGVHTGAGTILTTDPLLAPLGDYGGPTHTHLPLYGSPAINAATNSTATSDQRNLSVVSTPDLGAVEFQTATDLALLWETDFDLDGSPYGAELALGTDPGVSDPGNPRNLTAPVFQPNGSANLTFGYNEFAPPPAPTGSSPAPPPCCPAASQNASESTPSTPASLATRSTTPLLPSPPLATASRPSSSHPDPDHPRARLRATARFTSSSATTATRITAPTTANSMCVGIHVTRLIMFFRTCITAAPITTPITVPSPPRSEQPPSTAAAIAYSS